jgi:hypothetical protein
MQEIGSDWTAEVFVTRVSRFLGQGEWSLSAAAVASYLQQAKNGSLSHADLVEICRTLEGNDGVAAQAGFEAVIADALAYFSTPLVNGMPVAADYEKYIALLSREPNSADV